MNRCDGDVGSDGGNAHGRGARRSIDSRRRRDRPVRSAHPTRRPARRSIRPRTRGCAEHSDPYPDHYLNGQHVLEASVADHKENPPVRSSPTTTPTTSEPWLLARRTAGLTTAALGVSPQLTRVTLCIRCVAMCVQVASPAAKRAGPAHLRWGDRAVHQDQRPGDAW